MEQLTDKKEKILKTYPSFFDMISDRKKTPWYKEVVKKFSKIKEYDNLFDWVSNCWVPFS